MPLTATPLTDAKVRSLVPRERSYKVFDGHGLYLEVYPHGSKLWRIKYRFDGKDRRLSLGPYPEVGLKDARAEASKVRLKLRDGVDPATPKAGSTLQTSEPTFRDVAEDWAGRFLAQSEPATVKKKRLFLDKHILPTIGEMSIRKIDPPTILNLLMRPLEDRGQLETAHRLKFLCGQIFRYAIATGQADRDPTQDLRGAVPPPMVTHRATMVDPKKIGPLLRDLYNYDGHVVVQHALMLLPLVFVRPGELRHAEWGEIDWADRLWRIPAGKMKKVKFGLPHLVPLARQSIEILENLKRYTGGRKYLFPGQRGNDRPMSDMAVNAALRYLGYTGNEITGHGFRAMASTILNEKGYNRDWIERQLAHVERDNVRAAYNYAEYLPERRRMMQDWADYLESLRLTG